MADRLLKFFLSWGLCCVCLFIYGIAAAFYFAFCSLALGLIYTRQWRPGAEASWIRRGFDTTEVDAKMLPRDRLATIVRALLSLMTAWIFQRYA